MLTHPTSVAASLAFDLDDTLLNRQKRIGPRTLAALYDWLDSGRAVFLATSRPLRSVRAFIESDFLERCHLITLNGAVSQLAGRAPQRATAQLGAVTRAILANTELSGEVRLSIEFFGESFASNVAYSASELMDYHNASPAMLRPLDSIAHDEVSKIAIDGLGRRIAHHAAALQALGAHCIPALDGTFLNVVAPGVDKSGSLLKALQELGLSAHALCAFGDDTPDIGMLRVAGRKIAMSNACPAIMQMADHIIGDCDSDCIGPFIAENFPLT